VAPTLLARAGVPAARDLSGRPLSGLFLPGSLETATVATYGDRIAPVAASGGRETDREYLEKLKSLGYLN
ncbi:MAG TPA: phosphodiesterase, partial [Thermoanaerobaculia bacterium]|nr:phosphodiesterase [Thermoanaerobaculia bacterium]